jgi:hypothetical protein
MLEEISICAQAILQAVWPLARRRAIDLRGVGQINCRSLERDEAPRLPAQRRFSSIDKGPQIERGFERDDRGEDRSRSQRCERAAEESRAARSLRLF